MKYPPPKNKNAIPPFKKRKRMSVMKRHAIRRFMQKMKNNETNLMFTLPEGVTMKEFIEWKEQQDVNGTPLYTCNPFKNSECKKTGCRWLGMGECFQTLKEECKAEEEDKEQLGVLFVTHNIEMEQPPRFIWGWLAENTKSENI